MMGFTSWLVLVVTCFGAVSATCDEGCWETCFQVSLLHCVKLMSNKLKNGEKN